MKHDRAVALVTCLAFTFVTTRASAQQRPVTPPATPPPAPAIVHVEAKNPNVTLERLVKDDWELACSGACDKALPGGSYRISGSGIRESDPFTLAVPTGGHATIHATTKSTWLHITGLALIGLGVAVAGAGGIITTLMEIGKISGTIDQGLLTAGIGMMIAGGVTIVPGVVLTVMTSSSTATVTF